MTTGGPPGHIDARALLRKYELRAKKSWGQNFLVEERAYQAIVDACDLGPDDRVIEIGAGLGTLTARLGAVAGHVTAIERDRDLAAILREELSDRTTIEIAEANALTFDYAAEAARGGRPAVAVGNLPYQIASPILFRLIDARVHLKQIVVMLQKEMADRIVAKEDTKARSALSVMMQMTGAPRLVCRVRAGAFVPAPRVDSAVVALHPFSGGATRAQVSDPAWFSTVVHAAFGQRRKTLRNALKTLLSGAKVKDALAVLDHGLEAARIDPRRRGETLSVEELARLANQLEALRA
jgi:16S rRNA (adenine1518-N6/adenine1519-N6)-dimethyltransferase